MYYIGVDGGGTKTALSLIDENGNKVSAALSGPLNYNFVGVEKAVSNLKDGIEKLGIGDRKISAIGIGDPSIDEVSYNPKSKEFLSRVREIVDCPIYIKSDAYMTLYGLTEGKMSGVLLISGTGVMAIGEDKDKKVHVAAGWGRLTGDEGGGYYIGLSGLRAALKMADGIGRETILLNAALKHFGVKEPRELTAKLYGENAPDMAGFAASVAKCADKGDAVAKSILEETARVLADYAGVLMEKCDTNTLGVYGSVICKNEIVRKTFEGLIRERNPQVEIKELTVSAEESAALYAKNNLMGGK